MDKRRSRRHDVFSSTVVKNCNHFIKSFKGIYDSHLKQDMDAYGTFHEIYISIATNIVYRHWDENKELPNFIVSISVYI